MPHAFAHAPLGLQRIDAGQTQPRHRHQAAYAALVLRGGYSESGSRGRWHARAGDVLFHGAFEAHADRFGGTGAEILNLPLPLGWTAEMVFASCRDPGGIVACAARDPREAASRLLESVEPAAQAPADWPDLLVADLRADSRLALSDWAERHDLSPESLSRGVRRLYDVTPARLRNEIRAHKAWCGATRTTLPLAVVADETGFADQAHMTREVVKLTGRPPAHWRRHARL